MFVVRTAVQVFGPNPHPPLIVSENAGIGVTEA